MFCLPFSGGGASAYNGLRSALAVHATAPEHVVPLMLPGRESRIAEAPVFSIGAIADEIAPATGEPYALYGHSMGARIAFEVTRELRRRGLPLPHRLYAGAAHAPHSRVPLATTVDLPDHAFIEQLIRRIGAPEELRTEPELQELMLPVLRADFTWIKQYRYRPEAALGVPVVAFAGLEDHEVSPADAAGWARHGSAGFRLRTLRGGHFFVRDDPAELAALIAADLSPDLSERLAEGLPAEDEVWLTAVPASDGRPGAVVAEDGGLGLIAVAGSAGVGVGVARMGGLPEHEPARWLTAEELDELDGYAEEERGWLALRLLTAKRALAATTQQDGPADSGASPEPSPGLRDVPDLADPAPWPWGHGQISHLPLRTPLGEALAAVATPYRHPRLSLDIPAGQL